MQLGLIRHFKVNDQKPMGLITPHQFTKWVKHYDEAPIILAEDTKIDLEWEICFTSDLPRAIQTATSLCESEIIETALLREIPLTAISQKEIKLPIAAWSLAGRLAWLCSHSSQEETKSQTVKRAEECIKLVESTRKDKILLVSHSFFLSELSKTLCKAGYNGKRKRHFRNGELHVFEK